MKWPADRISSSSPKSFGMYQKAVKLMAQGIDVIHLEVGMPSFDTPQHIKNATIEALQSGLVHYGDFPGNASLRRAIVNRIADYNDLQVGEDEIIVTNGLTHASYAVLMAALDPGDEVILLEPYYPQHINKIELAGGKVVLAPLDKNNNFSIDPALIEEKITEKTRMICLVNPANPTGRVYSREELQGLAELAIKHDLLVLTDEVYEQICYDGNRHVSIASLPGMFERTFSLFAFTKAYAMDGWRVGYIVAHEKFIPGILKMTMNDVAHVNVFVQEGARAALEGPQDCIREMLADDCRRRDLVVQRLNRMPGVTCPVPQATIYAFPDISGTGKASREIADELLEKCRVVVETGVFYGSAGEGHLRICFGAEPYDRIEEAMNRMETYFSNLNDGKDQ
ncbi:pyridoxal phosphate-dependent aminotransferase [Emcibacter sp.]|uniref:pyridoxal phosphate-dependent aminotransferase n=1 Tax=Emcibacter sp. TaxID=1979954 RepID=UPI002AA7C3F5|nr:pyridoxal phosphate-dependent aminotransferase [Emcibacter sp.]